MRDPFLIVHFLGLAMGLGTSFAFMFLGMASSKMSEADAGDFMIKASIVGKMGNIGLVLLFISGGYLMTPYWSVLGTMPLMITKLVLFLVLGALMGVIGGALKKAKKGDLGQLAKVKKLGPLAMITGIAIVVLAVLQYH